MNPIFHLLCTGPFLSAHGSQATISRLLHDQQNHYELLRRQIRQERIARLTPQMMRSELADLDARIKAARGN